MIDDVVGWLALSLLLGPVRGGGRRRRVVRARRCSSGRSSRRPARRRAPDHRRRAPARRARRRRRRPGRVLSLVILLALFGAAATQAIGLHAIFGGFVVGLTVGGSSRINERTRVAIEDFVVNVFAPVFFASIGLRVDFVAAFDLRLAALVLVLATVPKLLGLQPGRARRGTQVATGDRRRLRNERAGRDGDRPGRSGARGRSAHRPDLRGAGAHGARDVAGQRAGDEAAALRRGARRGRGDAAPPGRLRQRAPRAHARTRRSPSSFAPWARCSRA